MKIEFSVGIPGEIVTHSFGDLGFGTRTFSAGDKAVLVGTFILSSRKWTVETISWTETNEYLNEDSIPDGLPVWRRKLKAGADSIAHATLTRTDDNLGVKYTQDAEVNNFRILVNGGNPLFPLAPNIDADLLLQVRPDSAGFAAKLTGTHDQFPEYSLLINGTSLYSFDPVDNGSSPDDLLGFNNTTVVTTWRFFPGS